MSKIQVQRNAKNLEWLRYPKYRVLKIAHNGIGVHRLTEKKSIKLVA